MPPRHPDDKNRQDIKSRPNLRDACLILAVTARAACVLFRTVCSSSAARVLKARACHSPLEERRSSSFL
eukprot:9503179-Pyramimonas_sp.AAC.1